MIKYLVSALAVMMTNCCLGQTDTLYVLEEVRIFGIPYDQLAVGADTRLMRLSSATAFDGIARESAIYLKEYGVGQLSTITLRGTSASQTNVIWNGLPANSPTLGLSDFSLWPAFFINQLVIERGASGSQIGNGAIGGSVFIDNRVIPKDSTLYFGGGIGSFGYHHVQGKAYFNSGKYSLETKFIHNSRRNNFPVHFNGLTERQANAGVTQTGISQRVNGRLGKHFLSGELVAVSTERAIQPSMGSTSSDSLQYNIRRAFLSDEYFVNNGSWYTSVGYASDESIFNQTDITSGSQFVFTLTRNHATPKIKLSHGLTYIRSSGNSGYYDRRSFMNQLNAFSAWTIPIVETIMISANMRGVYADVFQFLPSIGVHNQLNTMLSWRLQWSLGYRIPTFNDRYWVPGGNPYLDPEKATTYETGLTYDNGSRIKASCGFYYNDIQDWIQWVPIEGIWTPQNIREVATYGMELDVSGVRELGTSNLTWGLQYEYVIATDRSLEVVNQLAYVPKHSSFTKVGMETGAFSFNLMANYTGVRFSAITNRESDRMDDYLLIDLVAGYSISPSTGLAVELNNCLNTTYQNIRNLAMPGRNFQINLNIKY